MNSPVPQHPPLRLELCRGASPQGCPQALWQDAALPAALRDAADALGWPKYLRSLTTGPLPRHLGFAVSLCGCANGCSRPHIAALGLIPGRSPGWDAASCDCCRACVQACRENALRLEDHGLAIDRDACLRCGACLKACQAGALACAAQGYRVLIGGRLGRRPRLARELPGLYSPTAVLTVLRRSLELMMSRKDPAVRFAEAIDAAGADFMASLEMLGK